MPSTWASVIQRRCGARCKFSSRNNVTRTRTLCCGNWISQQVPFTPELTRLWVQLLFQQGEFDLAVAKARQVVSEKSERLQRANMARPDIGSRGAAPQAAKTRQGIFGTFSRGGKEPATCRGIEKRRRRRRGCHWWNFSVRWIRSSAAEEVIDQARGKIPADKAPSRPGPMLRSRGEERSGDGAIQACACSQTQRSGNSPQRGRFLSKNRKDRWKPRPSCKLIIERQGESGRRQSCYGRGASWP